MNSKSTGRHSLAITVSLAVHLSVVLAMMALPKDLRKFWDTVDVEMVKNRPEPEELAPEPDVEEEATPEEEPETPRTKLPVEKIKPVEPEPAPPEQEPEAEAEEAPPVFDLGDNTFAKGEGQGASWGLNRSLGNTKFAGVAQKAQKSVRGTAVKRETGEGKTGNGFTPVPKKDWSRSPEPAANTLDTSAMYTLEARRAGIEGKLRAQLFIGSDGRVKKVRVINDLGYGLSKKAEEELQKTIWRPALDKNGNPVDTIIVYTLTYLLD